MEYQLKQLLEYVEEMGKIPLSTIEDLHLMIVCLDKLGYNTHISDCTDYLIVEKK